MRWRVSLRPPRAINRRGEFVTGPRRRLALRFASLPPVTGRDCARYSVSASCADLPERHHTFLVALAAHQHVSSLKLQVFEFGVDDFRNPQRSRIENFQHGAITGSQRGRVLRVARGAAQCERSGQRCFHFVASQRLRKNLPLPWRLDVQAWDRVRVSYPAAGSDKDAAAPKVFVPRCGHRLDGKKAACRKSRTSTASCGQQQALAFFQKFRELANVGGVGADGKRRQSLLDSQIVEKAGEHARVRFQGHEMGDEWSMRVIGR